MARRADHIGFPLMPLARGADLPLQAQVHAGLREAILQGGLPPGSRLPSSRALAEHLHVSRNTAQAALERLCAEGYAETRHGSGTYVGSQVQWERSAPVAPEAPPPVPRPCAVRGSLQVDRALAEGLPLAPGLPWVPEPLRTLWGRLLGRHCRRGPALFGYGDPRGHPELRAALARHLAATRAVRCDPDQLLLFTSSQQAFDLVLRFAQAAPGGVAMEDPGHLGFRLAVQAEGRACLPVPLDAQGLDATQLPESAGLLFVTPSCQYPTGLVMPLARRLQLLAWAGRRGASILEYDYLGALRYVPYPQPSLQGLDREGVVLYVGTCSEALFPAARTVYLVAPRHLLDRLVSAREAVGGFGNLIEQAALAELFTEGYVDAHLRRVRKEYEVRREILARALGPGACLQGGDASLHAVLWLSPGRSDAELARRARQLGLGVVPVSALSCGQPVRPGLLVGYGACSLQSLDRAARLLAGLVGRVP